jgi:hypothetical protein
MICANPSSIGDRADQFRKHFAVPMDAALIRDSTMFVRTIEITPAWCSLACPGLEKRIARFPQFYSRIGFVHEFRPPDPEQVQTLLESRWAPAGVTLPDEQLLPEVIASLIRMSGGNFRLLTRLLTQIERLLGVNDLHLVSNAVVEAARDSLVIGPG